MAGERAKHRYYHDSILNGKPVKRTPSDKVVWKGNDTYILAVNSQSPPKQRERAEKVGLIANRETGYDFLPYHARFKYEDNTYAFILVKDSKAIGFIVTCMPEAVWNSSEEKLSSGSHNIALTICFIWIAKNCRQKGYGKLLVDKALKYQNKTINNVGWYPPLTKLGEKLALNLCPNGLYYAK